MADLIVTVGNVVAGSSPGIETAFLAGATITRGQPVYLTASNTWALADNDVSALAAGSSGIGISLSDVVATQNMIVQTSGTLNFGAILTKGTVYCVSSTAGGICPVADLGAGDYVTILGVASSTSVLTLRVWASGITI